MARSRSTRTRVAGGVAALAFVFAALVGTAAPSEAKGRSPFDVQQDYLAWAIGSNTNPIFHGEDDYCGETVGRDFYLTPGPDFVTVRTCDVPAGSRLVTSVVFATAWYPTD